jgi:RNA polymerase sigma-70 factor, ECF subfamily
MIAGPNPPGSKPDLPQPSSYHPDRTDSLAAYGIGENDPAAFGRLYDRLAPELLTWIRLRIAPAFHGQLAPEDLLSEVWLRALRSFGTYDSSRPFRGWIFSIARNLLINGYRSLRARGETNGSSRKRVEFDPDLRAEATSVSLKVANSELAERLYDFGGQLEEKDRAIFLHCGLEDLSTPQVAEITGMTVAAVTKRWQRLRQRLRGGFPELSFGG